MGGMNQLASQVLSFWQWRSQKEFKFTFSGTWPRSTEDSESINAKMCQPFSLDAVQFLFSSSLLIVNNLSSTSLSIIISCFSVTKERFWQHMNVSVDLGCSCKACGILCFSSDCQDFWISNLPWMYASSEQLWSTWFSKCLSLAHWGVFNRFFTSFGALSVLLSLSFGNSELKGWGVGIY